MTLTEWPRLLLIGKEFGKNFNFNICSAALSGIPLQIRG